MARLSKRTLDGHVETFLLAVLEDGPSYGYQIVRELNERGDGLLRFGEGTVYPVLHRMERRGLITARWSKAESGRPRKYYRLTRKGRRAQAEQRDQWQQLKQVMERMLEPADGRDSGPAAGPA
jgi:DNA-binding PadR family transcriptional regulator